MQKKIEFKLFGFVAKLCPISSNCASKVFSINRCTFPLKFDYSSRCKNSPESCGEKRSIGWQRTCVSNLWTLAHLTYNAMTINKHRNKFATLLSTLNIYALKSSQNEYSRISLHSVDEKSLENSASSAIYSIFSCTLYM